MEEFSTSRSPSALSQANCRIPCESFLPTKALKHAFNPSSPWQSQNSAWLSPNLSQVWTRDSSQSSVETPEDHRTTQQPVIQKNTSVLEQVSKSTKPRVHTRLDSRRPARMFVDQQASKHSSSIINNKRHFSSFYCLPSQLRCITHNLVEYRIEPTARSPTIRRKAVLLRALIGSLVSHAMNRSMCTYSVL